MWYNSFSTSFSFLFFFLLFILLLPFSESSLTWLFTSCSLPLSSVLFCSIDFVTTLDFSETFVGQQLWLNTSSCYYSSSVHYLHLRDQWASNQLHLHFRVLSFQQHMVRGDCYWLLLNQFFFCFLFLLRFHFLLFNNFLDFLLRRLLK